MPRKKKPEPPPLEVNETIIYEPIRSGARIPAYQLTNAIFIG
jgi:hypothetical protein